MPEPALTPTPETLRLLNEEVSARVGRLDTNTARLDIKATTLLGFIWAACTFLATQPIGGWWKVPAYAAFVAAATLGFQSMRPRTFKDAPEPDAVLQFLVQRPETNALNLILNAKVRAFKDNQATHERKANNWRRCLAAFSLAVVFMIGALILGGQHRLTTPTSGGTRPSTVVPNAPSDRAPATVAPSTPTQPGGRDGGRGERRSDGKPPTGAPG
jgi:hypothetical protein